MIKWVLLLAGIMCCMGCVKPPSYKDSRYPVTALLNDSLWFGNAQAVKTREENGNSCSANRFHLFIRTDIPYDNQIVTNKAVKITGCLTECIPTQRITFFNLPLKSGKYKLAKLDACGVIDKDHSYFVLLLNGTGSGIFKSYRPKKRATDWVRITKYDSATNLIEGQFALNLDGYFDLNLPDHTASTANFKHGRFRVNLSK